MNIVGINSYGLFYNYDVQTIKSNSAIIFEKHNLMKNLHHVPDGQNIKILVGGLYNVNLTIYMIDVGKIAIYVNGDVMEETMTKGDKCININTILFLHKGDNISIRNYDTVNSIITDSSQITNIRLYIYKISSTNNISYPITIGNNQSSSHSESESDSGSHSNSESESDSGSGSDELCARVRTDTHKNIILVIDKSSGSDSSSSIK